MFPSGPAARLALLYAALFFELGINLPFFPVWLRSRALDATEIGFVLALPFALRIVANPAMAALADATGRLRAIVIGCAVAAAAGFLVLPVAGGLAGIVLVVALIALAQGPLIALTDAATLRILSVEVSAERRYGRIRLAGSLAFAAASLVGGAALAERSPGVIAGLLAVASVLVAAATLALPAVAIAPAAAAGVPEHRTAGFAVLAAAVTGPALVQASHAALYGFGTLHWQALGFSGPTLGLLWTLGIAGEVLFFWAAGSLASGERGAVRLLSVGAAGAALRWALMATDPPLALLAPLQVLHGLSFGATHLGSVFLLAGLAPARSKAQAQAWLAAIWAVAMAALTSLAGLLVEGWGQAVYWPMAAVALVGLGLVRLVAAALTSGRPRPATLG